MFKNIVLASLVAVIMSGCLNSTGVHLYNGAETTFRKGAPVFQAGATGEVTYCDAGLSTLVESRRKEAFAIINDTCKGDNYTITGESPGHSASCTLDRTIVFKCNSGKKKTK